MSIKLNLLDNEYPTKGKYHERKVARAFIYDEDGRFAIHLIHRDDIFGNETYYETPGGGVDENETYEEGLRREIKEEVGFEGDIDAFLGEVDDYYNLINRHNLNKFYLMKRTNKVSEPIVASEGDSLIQKTLWLDIDEIISLYEKQSDARVSGIVKRRELPIAKEAKRLFNLERNETK